MFDGLRNDASNTSGFDDQPVEFYPDDKPASRQAKKTASRSSKFLGLTPVQRFILALMLMFSVCLLGAVFLIFTGKFVF
jgi:hypothetical protein